jgi:hypothetical protein
MRAVRRSRTSGRCATFAAGRLPAGASVRARPRTRLRTSGTGFSRQRSIPECTAQSCAGSTGSVGRERPSTQAIRQVQRPGPPDRARYWELQEFLRPAPHRKDRQAWQRSAARAGEAFRCGARVSANGQRRSCGWYASNTAMFGRLRRLKDRRSGRETPADNRVVVLRTPEILLEIARGT